MPVLNYDREADEVKQMESRVEQARTQIQKPPEFLWDKDHLGVDALADSESVLIEAHQVAFPTFQWVGVEKIGPWYRTRFRLR